MLNLRFVNNSDEAISKNTTYQSVDVRSVKGGAALAALGGRGGSVRLRGMEGIHGSEVEARNFTAVNARNGVQTRAGREPR